MSVALYKPFGIAGIVIGTAASSAAMTLAQMHFLRRQLHGRLDGRRTAIAVAKMTVAAALLAAVTYGVWKVLDTALGRGLVGQVLSVGVGLTAGAVVYGVAVHADAAFRRRARSSASSSDAPADGCLAATSGSRRTDKRRFPLKSGRTSADTPLEDGHG